MRTIWLGARSFLPAAVMAAIATASYGRTTGYDPLLRFFGPNQVAAHAAFAMLVAFSAFSSALLIAKRPPKDPPHVIALATMLAVAWILGVGVLSSFVTQDPGKWMRMNGGPTALGLLPILGALSLQRALHPASYCTDYMPRVRLAIASFALGLATYFLRHTTGIHGFVIQQTIGLLVAVVPLIALATATTQLAAAGKLMSLRGFAVACATAATLAVLTTL